MHKLTDMDMYRFFDEIANSGSDPKNAGRFLIKPTLPTFVFDQASQIDISRFYNTLCMFYTPGDAREYIVLVENLQTIFRCGFQIDGLERLLAVNYTEIEWSMFLEYDFRKKQSKYYRDHFFHQFRDAFLAFRMIDLWGWENRLCQWLQDGKRVLSRYIGDCCKQSGKDAAPEDMGMRILMKSILISAVFHDLGYPLSYLMRMSSQIEKSLPYYSVVCNASKAPFQQIKSVLFNTLLFRTAPIEQIEEKYNSNDHGVLSAICFLLNFYSSGAIFNLPPADRCIIELSGRSIYDHTNKYTAPARMTFDENPVSYLLRICDDMQEWSRFGLSVDENSNAMLRPETFETISRREPHSRWYGTSAEPELFYKTTDTKYKKINFINACDHLGISGPEESPHTISIVYRPFSLMEIATMNFSYALYRHCELEQLKGMICCQNYIPDIKLDYTLSNNIFWLAQQIVSRKGPEPDSLPEQDPGAQRLADRFREGGADKVLEALKAEIECGLDKYGESLLAEPMLEESFKNCAGRTLTTAEYSEYLHDSKAFWAKYGGLLGFMSQFHDC